ncbi:MAG TPA: AMP-binding protein [Thermodesulfobacteriota bacterium]|nr:AMP-binding protein [Thermodesulfobacteriota bacterium]
MKITPLHDWTATKIGISPFALTQEAIRAFQLRKLREVLSYVQQKSPFYRAHLGNRAVLLNALEDLAALPVTTSKDIRNNPLHFICGSQDEIERVVTLASSGTTGEPKRIFFTRQDQEETMDFFRVGMSALVEAGDRVLILFPGERPGSAGDLLLRALDRIGVRGIPHGLVHDISSTLDIIGGEKVDCLVGIPYQILALTRGKALRRTTRPYRLKSILLSGDYVSPALIATIEQEWACAAFIHYGMTEMGLGGAVQCGARVGLHPRESDLYFEIIDPVTSVSVPPGEEGEIVFTTLTTGGMPLIRYRTGDVSRFLPDPCLCGTMLRRLDRIKDRVSGSVELAEGARLTMPDLEDALCPIEGLLGFSATIDRYSTQERLTVRAEFLESHRDAAIRALDAALNTLPAIRVARATSALIVSVETGSGYTLGTAGLSKRRILDQRSLSVVPAEL